MGRIRDLGYFPGRLPPGTQNSILDVPGVQVGQSTIHSEQEGIHTGVTVILPRGDETDKKYCYAGLHVLNGIGEMTGAHQIQEYGYMGAPIAFTNSISVGKVYDALWAWALERCKDEDDLKRVRHFSFPVSAETYDGYLNDISRSAVEKSHVFEAISQASKNEPIQEGNHGGGTGMICSEFKGGIGTSSRLIERSGGGHYTLGVIVQANFGTRSFLEIGGVPVGKLIPGGLKKLAAQTTKASEGSILVLIITDAPLLPHQLRRVAQRAGIGLAKIQGTGTSRNFSGDIFLALSTAGNPEQLAETKPEELPTVEVQTVETVKNETINTLFAATAEATEEAVLNSLCGGETLKGYKGRVVEAMPQDKVAELLKKHLVK